MKSKEFQENHKLLTHPEGFSPEYNVLMNAKFAMTHEVSHRNFFNSNFIYWLDMGYGHGHDVFPKDHKWTPHNIMLEPYRDKITYIALRDINLVRNISQLYKQKVRPAVNGGFFGGSRQAVDKYYHLFNEIWSAFLEHYKIDDDQTLAVACWLRNKDLFNMVRGDWYDVFKLFV